MKHRYFYFMIGLMIVLSGCQHIAREPETVLFHGIEDGILNSRVLKSTFRMEKFKGKQNIITHPLIKSNSREILAVQIRDREQPHLHENHDLTVYLYRSKGALRSPGDSIPMQAGDWISIERNLPHQFITRGSKPAQALVIRTPAVEDDYVELDSVDEDEDS